MKDQLNKIWAELRRLAKLIVQKEDKWAETIVDLSSEGWSANTQTETITGITSSSDVEVYPPVDRTAFINYGNAQISATSTGTNTITFTCTTTPTSNINSVIVKWRN